jgi:hypothetical protein
MFSKVMFLTFMIFSTAAFADVTPAHQALDKVQKYLAEKAEYEASRIVPQHKSLNYLVEQSLSLGRGKYSDEFYGFSDFSGSSEYLFQWSGSDEYYRVKCGLSAQAAVVSFAKQMHPILEEEANTEQLILKRVRVSCRRVY